MFHRRDHQASTTNSIPCILVRGQASKPFLVSHSSQLTATHNIRQTALVSRGQRLLCIITILIWLPTCSHSMRQSACLTMYPPCPSILITCSPGFQLPPHIQPRLSASPAPPSVVLLSSVVYRCSQAFPVASLTCCPANSKCLTLRRRA